jgi:CBS domain-containing protein
LRIRIHYSWVPVFALMTAIVTVQYVENYTLLQRVFLGIAVSLLFFAALTIREFILSIATSQIEIPIKKITLFAFGGVYQENRERIVSTHLPTLYLARFLSSFVIAAIFYGTYATFINAGSLTLAGIAQWLTYLYFLIFLLHFLPVFPLDGGQILRLILWHSTGDYYKATQIASWVGWATGVFIIFSSILVYIVTRQWIISLILVLTGWIIQIAANYTRRQMKIHMALKTIQAEDVMTRDYPLISGQVNIKELIRKHVLVNGWRYVVVVDNGKLKGVLTLKQIRMALAKRRRNTTIGDIMAASNKIRTTHRQQPANMIYEEMYQWEIEYIPVLEDEKVIGVVTRQALMNLVDIRSGFGI